MAKYANYKKFSDNKLKEAMCGSAEEGNLEEIQAQTKELFSRHQSQETNPLDFVIKHHGYTVSPLHRAVQNGHPKVVQFFLDKGADSNIQGKDDQFGIAEITPLHWLGNSSQTIVGFTHEAMERNQQIEEYSTRAMPEIAEMLIKKGADVNARQEWRTSGATALSNLVTRSAMSSNATSIKAYDDTISLLMKHGANPAIGTNRNAWIPTEEIPRYSDKFPKSMQSLISSIIHNDSSPLRDAIQSGDVKSAQNLIDCVHKHGKKEDYATCLKLVIESLLTPDKNGNTVLLNLIKDEKFSAAQEILDFAENYLSQQQMSLFVNAKDTQGCTAFGLLEATQRFLDKGGNALTDQELGNTEETLIASLKNHNALSSAAHLADASLKSKLIEDLVDAQFNDFGNADLYGITLSIAQRHERRKAKGGEPYHIYAVDEDDFKAFLKETKALAEVDSTRPLRITYITEFPSGGHWGSGTITFNQDKSVTVSIIDSLADKSYYKPLADKIAKVFPEATIVANHDRQQGAYAGCTIFSIDNANHMANWHEDTAEHMLENPIKKIETSKGNIVTVGELPPRMLRTIQSMSTLGTRIDKMPDKEFLKPVSSTDRILTHTLGEHHEFRDFRGDTKLQNTRLETKTLEQLRERNKKFIETRSLDKLVEQTRAHTLDGLKSIIKAKTQAHHIDWIEKSKNTTGRGSYEIG